ncbi:MAG: DUF1648 domain-containing protein [Terriglobales bacterium]
MNQKLFHLATALLWLALPIVALQYRHSWDQLPARMAVHFNAANQANGWMTREQSLDFNLSMIAIALVISTIVLVAASWRSVASFGWVLLGFFAVLIGFLLSVNQAVINYNANGAPIHPVVLMLIMAVAVAALILAYLLLHRQAPLPDGKTLTIETHAGRAWSLVILIAMTGPIIAMVFAAGAVRIPMLLLLAVGIFAFAMAWAGFQYRFMQHGLDIRMLGLRLRSIPRSAILSYAIEPWSFIRGYGIRGIGTTRAYVWCNKVVHIKTSNGDIYLGHNDPARVVRDLDQMMGLATSG